MGIIENAQKAVGDAIIAEGRALLHSKYPDEIEYYALSLELTDSKNRTLDVLTFPVMPNTINSAHNHKVNIKQSMGGLMILDSPVFTPDAISLKGSFGRKFKYIFGRANIDNIGNSDLTEGEALHLGKGVTSFSNTIKSGYGLTKVLELILRRAKEVDKYGETNRLFLYNLTLNNHYLVHPENWSFNQTYESSNMVWNYEINFTTLAYSYYVKTESELKRRLVEITNRDIVQRLVGKIGNEVQSEITSMATNIPLALRSKQTLRDIPTIGSKLIKDLF